MHAAFIPAAVLLHQPDGCRKHLNEPRVLQFVAVGCAAHTCSRAACRKAHKTTEQHMRWCHTQTVVWQKHVESLTQPKRTADQLLSYFKSPAISCWQVGMFALSLARVLALPQVPPENAALEAAKDNPLESLLVRATTATGCLL
jgi:hypothetical protein